MIFSHVNGFFWLLVQQSWRWADLTCWLQLASKISFTGCGSRCLSDVSHHVWAFTLTSYWLVTSLWSVCVCCEVLIRDGVMIDWITFKQLSANSGFYFLFLMIKISLSILSHGGIKKQQQNHQYWQNWYFVISIGVGGSSNWTCSSLFQRGGVNGVHNLCWVHESSPRISESGVMQQTLIIMDPRVVSKMSDPG